VARPKKLDDDAISAWLRAHAGWAREGDALARELRFPDFAAALAFAVRVGMIAEKRDHHPDLLVGWGKVKVVWTTHDAGGITELDVALAEATDALGASA
jgi:4a-hydroxytetrahydrobiopterin dehydratase